MEPVFRLGLPAVIMVVGAGGVGGVYQHYSVLLSRYRCTFYSATSTWPRGWAERPMLFRESWLPNGAWCIYAFVLEEAGSCSW